MSSFIYRFDSRLIKHIQAWPGWVHPLMSTMTFIGEPLMIGVVAAAAAAVALKNHQHAIAWAFGWSLVACGLNSCLKLFLHRTRPDTLYVTSMRFKSYSFPSGHAFGSLVVFGLLAYLALKHLPSPWSYLAAGVLSVLIILIGISRVYLGAHYPTDVLGGWMLGAVALALIIRIILPR